MNRVRSRPLTGGCWGTTAATTCFPQGDARYDSFRGCHTCPKPYFNKICDMMLSWRTAELHNDNQCKPQAGAPILQARHRDSQDRLRQAFWVVSRGARPVDARAKKSKQVTDQIIRSKQQLKHRLPHTRHRTRNTPTRIPTKTPTESPTSADPPLHNATTTPPHHSTTHHTKRHPAASPTLTAPPHRCLPKPPHRDCPTGTPVVGTPRDKKTGTPTASHNRRFSENGRMHEREPCIDPKPGGYGGTK